MKGRNGMEEERIRELEDQLQAEETKIKALFLTAKIPTQGDYAERDRIRKELKTARRVRAMNAKRMEPKLTRSYNLTFPENEFSELSERAEKRGVILSSYIRNLIRIGLKVEDEASVEGRNGG